MLDGEAWVTWGGGVGFSALGREITRKRKAAVSKSWSAGPTAPAGAAYTLLNTAEMLSRLPIPRREEFAAFAGRSRGDEGAPRILGNKHFWRSDYMSHRRE